MSSGNQSKTAAEKPAEVRKPPGTAEKRGVVSKSRLENPLLGVTALLERYGYQLGEILGKGSYAVVRKANSKRHKKTVAIKIICKKKAPDDFLTKFLPREIKILKKIRHTHVISLIEVIESNTRMYIITEVAENGDLLEHIRNNGAISEAKTKTLFQQLIEGVLYIHKQDIVHRDLKCENLLLDKDLNLIISDFGFARDNLTTPTGRRKLSHTYCGSYAYAPPEILKGIAYDATLADIWSMGVILYTMLCGRLPFDDSNLRSLLQQVHKKVTFSNKVKVSEEVKNLVHKMLAWNIHERITVEQLGRDPWVKQDGEHKKQEKRENGEKAEKKEDEMKEKTEEEKKVEENKKEEKIEAHTSKDGK